MKRNLYNEPAEKRDTQILARLSAAFKRERTEDAAANYNSFKALLFKAGQSSNKVVFLNWYAQPIHCPFCGTALEPTEQVSCKHLLYIIHGGNFIIRSARFDAALGVEPESGEWWPEFGEEEKARFGPPHLVVNLVRDAFVNSIEFHIDDPGDVCLIGFAALEEELCGWGIHHQSPYAE
jgi:hypothetical protein